QVIRQEEKFRVVPVQEKRELLGMIEGKTQNQVERVLVEARPVAMQTIQESRRQTEPPLPGNRRELRVVISEGLYRKWEKLKDLRSQASYERSPEALMEWLVELGLDH